MLGKMSMPNMMLLITGYLLFLLLCTTMRPVFTQLKFHEMNSFCLAYSGNYTAKSPYQNNLNVLLPSVINQASIAGFGSFSAGEGVDKLYMLYNCRGDLNGQDCHDCVHRASELIVVLCPIQREAIYWMLECMLRYANRVISPLEDELYYGWYSSYTNVSNPQKFSQVLAKTMDALITKAAYDNTTKGYAVAQTNWSDKEKVYCLVQCTPYILGSPCEKCLHAALRSFAGCCGTSRTSGVLTYPSCNIRYSDTPFVTMTDIQSSPPPQSTIGKGSSTKGKEKSVVTTVVVPTVAAMILVLISVCGWFYISGRTTEEVEIKGPCKPRRNIKCKCEISVPESLQFDFNAIKVATDDFSEENKLGQGGFGAVYKGRLQNGQELAVKRLSANSGQGIEEFKTEALLVVKLQHKNLVKLLGFCVEGKEKLLVYELVPNSSLDKFLFDPEKCVLLDWQTRYKIIAGIARGLMYLHEDSRLTIIHRDLKCSNILLDKAMNPKISDFGTARLFGADQIQANTNRIVGTYGYMAPEYAMHGHFSIKSDVYSFGVIILEIVSGKSNSSTRSSEYRRSLVHHAWTLWNNNEAVSLVDMALGKHVFSEQVIKCIHIGLLCVQDDPNKRPTMLKIVHALNDTSSNLPAPAGPQLLMINEKGPTQVSCGSLASQNAVNDTDSSSQGLGTFSATAEISDLYPR